MQADLLAKLAPNLADRSAALRRATLQLLCRFRQPPLPAAARDLTANDATTIAAPGIVADPLPARPAASATAATAVGESPLTAAPSRQQAAAAAAAAAASDPAEIDLEGDEDAEETEGEAVNADGATARMQEANVPRSDVLPLLLTLEEDDPSLGLGRLVSINIFCIYSC